MSAIPGGSGAPEDCGITTCADAEIEMTAEWDPGDPEQPYDGECTVTIIRSGAVSGDLPAAEYEWYIPGDSGEDPGPVFEFNQWTETKTIKEGNYFGGYWARSGIQLSVVDLVPIPPDLDEAHAKQQAPKNVRCGADVSGFGDPLDEIQDLRDDPPDPGSLQSDPTPQELEDAKRTLCLEIALPFCR